jgi:hypothetical protein
MLKLNPAGIPAWFDKYSIETQLEFQLGLINIHSKSSRNSAGFDIYSLETQPEFKLGLINVQIKPGRISSLV